MFKVFRWLEFFAGTAMATACVTGAGYTGAKLDINYHSPTNPEKQNYYDILSPAGMAC